LYNLKGDPFKNTNLPYTPGEIQVYNKNVLDREKGLCEYCGEPAEHVHHIYPKKLEPFFALDPDYGVACCAKHHYKYAHKDECSTGNLANIVCSVESQKFLNQTLEDI
jgi:5-methylcytosine-specific restriction endonuclease McrA